MKLPENGRLFVGGISPSTGDVDLRSHFRRFGEVADIYLPKDSITGRPRRFAFVQFIRPSDAARALADPHHVINGRQMRVGKAEPRRLITPQCQRIFRSRNKCYRVGDMMSIYIGPITDDCEDDECVKEAKKLGAFVDKTLMFSCVIGYISEDGKECLVRWPPVQRDDRGPPTRRCPVYGCQLKYKSTRSCQGSIIPSYECPLKDLVNIANNRRLEGTTSTAAKSPGDATPPQNWCWLIVGS